MNAIVGMTVSATAVEWGMGVPMAVVLTLGMFAGAAQFAAMAALATAGGAVAGWVAAMLVNARFLFLGAGVARRLTLSRVHRLAVAGLLVDPVVILAQRESEDVRATRTFVAGGAVTLLGWMVGSFAGALGVGYLNDSEAIGLDVALPALLLAIVASGARSREQRLAAVSGAAVAVALLLLQLAPAVVVLGSALGVLVPISVRGRAQWSGGNRPPGSVDR